MIAAWMVYAVALSLLLSLAGIAAEAGLRALGRPGRWGVLAGLAASVGLPAVAYLTPEVFLTTVGERVSLLGPVATILPTTMPFPDGTWPFAPASHPILDATLLVLWGAGSLAALLAGILIQRGLTRRALRSPAASIQGTAVRSTRCLGPAVVGVRRGIIVFPDWARALAPEDQRLSLLHEEEHLRARDPLLLFGAYLLVALEPWNPALWWQLVRLKGAVERDCDRRVLARGGDPRAYASLLLRLAAIRQGSPPFALAIWNPGTRVGRRIVEMADGLAGVRPGRAGILSGLSLLILALGCWISPPSAGSPRLSGRDPLRSHPAPPPVGSAPPGPGTPLPTGPVRVEGPEARRVVSAIARALQDAGTAESPLDLPLEGGGVLRMETMEHPSGATLTLALPDSSQGRGRFRRVSLGVEVVEGEPVLTFKEG